MKTYLIATILLLYSVLAVGQVLNQPGGESAEHFAKRFIPVNSVLTHNVITTNWNLKPVIIAFYDQVYKLPIKNDPDQQEYHRIIATLFIQKNDKQYNKVIIDTIDTEGGDPKIASVFFANADNELKKELILITTWEQRHQEVNGTLYGTSVYDNLSNDDQKNLLLLKKISNQLSGNCECNWSDGSRKTAKFKTAADIKTELKRLGYK